MSDYWKASSRRGPRLIVPVHYAGVGCEMDVIGEIAARHGMAVVEDNAHGLFGKYRGRWLGTFGCLAAQSFHETKNITCGEGGALLINDARFIERAEIIREKGTNRSQFFRGQVDKYSWVGIGSSYVMSDVLAAFLYAQLEVWPARSRPGGSRFGIIMTSTCATGHRNAALAVPWCRPTANSPTTCITWSCPLWKNGRR